MAVLKHFPGEGAPSLPREREGEGPEIAHSLRNGGEESCHVGNGIHVRGDWWATVLDEGARGRYYNTFLSRHEKDVEEWGRQTFILGGVHGKQ